MHGDCAEGLVCKMKPYYSDDEDDEDSTSCYYYSVGGGSQSCGDSPDSDSEGTARTDVC